MTAGPAAGLPCSAASAGRGELLGGTASRVRRWLLVEQPGPWGADALADSRLDPEVAAGLAAAGRRHGVRVVLLRAVSWRSDFPGRTVLLAHTGPEHRWLERLTVDDPADLLTLDLSLIARPDPPGAGRPGPPAVHLVCTNGRHDRCCAELGRPVVRALAGAGTPEVWECSHIGGDRFAPNIVGLPSGVYLGRVPPERAAAIVGDLAAGRLDLDHYRGRSCYPPLVQAAEIFARRELDERRLDGMRPVSSRAQGPDALTVVLATAGGRMVEATVQRVRSTPARLTCTAAAPAAPWDYRLTSFRRQ